MSNGLEDGCDSFLSLGEGEGINATNSAGKLLLNVWLLGGNCAAVVGMSATKTTWWKDPRGTHRNKTTRRSIREVGYVL